MKPIVLAVCLVIFGFFSPARGMPPAAAAGESREFSYNWQAGDDYLYHCIFRSHSVMRLPGPSGTPEGAVSHFLLDGVMVLHCYGRQADGTIRFGVRFKDIAKLQVDFNGRPIIDQETIPTLAGNREIIADFFPNGKLKEIKRFPNNPGLQVRLLASLVGEMQTVVPHAAGQRQWQAAETHYYGHTQADYQRLEPGGKQIQLKKRTMVRDASFRPENDSINDEPHSFVYDITLNNKGWLESLSATSITRPTTFQAPGNNTAPTTSISINLLTVKKSSDHSAAAKSAPDDRNAIPYDLTGNAEKKLARKNILEKQAADLNPEVFKSWAQEYHRGMVTDGKEIFTMKTRMAAVLALHPELCQDMETLFFSLPANSPARPMIAGVLVLADTRTAQQSLRHILADNRLRRDDNFIQILQLPAFLQHPTKETGEFYQAIINNPAENADARYAAIYTLGSISAEMRRRGMADMADEYNQYLVNRLQKSGNPDEIHALLFGLRNSKYPQNAPVAVTFLQKKQEEKVRFAAARALGAFTTENSTNILLHHLHDPSYLVRNGILQSLIEHQLSENDLNTIQKLVGNNILKPETDPLLLELVQKELAQQPEAGRKILRAMRKRGIANRDVKHKVQLLLDSRKPRKK